LTYNHLKLNILLSDYYFLKDNIGFNTYKLKLWYTIYIYIYIYIYITCMQIYLKAILEAVNVFLYVRYSYV